MPDTWDLEIDTYWIRRAAGSVDEASRAFAAAAADLLPPFSTGLGPSEAAASALTLVRARNGQAHAAAAQLQAVAAAVGRQLHDVADHFDRLEAAIAVPHR